MKPAQTVNLIRQVSAGFYHSELEIVTFSCVVPPALAVLLISPLMPGSTKFLRRSLLALWLALFLWSGLQQIFVYPYPISTYPWTVYFVYGLMLGVPLLVIASRRIASLGLIRLTVCAGFIVALTYDVLNFAYSYDWFGMYVRLRVGMWITPDATDWTQYLLVWLGFPGWLNFRLITYLGLGYVLAKRKGLLTGVAISVVIGLMDCALGWLVFLPGKGDFEAPPLSVVLQYDLPEFLKALLAQVTILAALALLGAFVAQVRWPRALVRPVRSIPATRAQYRPASQIETGVYED